MEIHRASVLGATGTIGRSLVRELVRRGIPTRVVSRSEEKLGHDFGRLPVERRAADLLEPGEATLAASGADVVFHCVGLPAERYDAHLPIARNTVQAMRDTGARGVLISSYWSYAPLPDGPLSEDHPRPGSNPLSRLRKELEDLFCEAGGAVCLLPDFWGPDCSLSILNDALAALVRGGTVRWPGDADAPREFLYAEDAGPLIVRLSEQEGAYARLWIVAGGTAISPRNLLGEAAALRGRRLRLVEIAPWQVALAAPFSSRIRAFRSVYPIYRRPASFDPTRLHGLIGPYGTTPYARGLRPTLQWLERHAH